jgi:cytosine/adenosine deaminase-related metal-dependent hydrolase
MCADVYKALGFDNVEYFHHLGLTGQRLVLAHCIWLSDREKQILADTGTKVVHCPTSNLKLASGIADIPGLLKKRVTIGLAADGAPCNNQLSGWNEMRLAAFIQKPIYGATVMPAQEVLDMATLGGAQVLGMEDEIGSIEVGKKADFCLIERDATSRFTVGLDANRTFNRQALISSLVYSTDPTHVVGTWVDGKRVFSA